VFLVAARWWLLLPAALVAGSAMAAVALTGFDGLYGQDSFAYFGYATGALRESLLHLSAWPAFFWPPGYPLLVAVVSLVAGRLPFAGQIVSAGAGAAVAIFTGLLATELVKQQRADGLSPKASFDRLPVPLLAGLIVAVTGQLLQSSIVVMSDTVGLAAATAGAWAFARYRRTGAGRWLALCAGAFAWAIVTRWIYGLIALVFIIQGLILVRQQHRRAALRHAAGAAVIGALILAPTLVPAALGLFRGGDPPFSGDLLAYSWNPLNALHREFVTADGQLSYPLPNGLYYLFAPATWWYFGPILAALIVPGLWGALRRRTVSSAGLLLAWVAIVYAFHAGAPWQNPRFALAYLPPLAILAAIGFTELREATDLRIRRLAAAYLAIGLALAAVGSGLLTERFTDRKQHDLATVRWVEHVAPPRAHLLTFGLTATFQHYGRPETADLSQIRWPQMQRLLSDGRPTLVLLDVANIERQWTGRPPWANYRALRDGPGLIRLGARGSYTLFAVQEGVP
jgi:4-amino-4-deoxy-L-arabinose transferase-like glycosyltransferase